MVRSKFPLLDLVEVDEDAYTQWLERWLREARERREAAPALGPPAAHALEPAVPPAHAVEPVVPAAGLPPTPASGTDLPLPPEALYWKVVEGPVHHVGQIVQSESVGDGDDGDATLRMLCKDSGIGAPHGSYATFRVPTFGCRTE